MDDMKNEKKDELLKKLFTSGRHHDPFIYQKPEPPILYKNPFGLIEIPEEMRKNIEWTVYFKK